ncbi:MAG: hypothetical protein H6Q87_875, partial [candidate division NC10 bacterium]|nr:hypothetical protein [candidate division NC10 bacterium]
MPSIEAEHLAVDIPVSHQEDRRHGRFLGGADATDRQPSGKGAATLLFVVSVQGIQEGSVDEARGDD